MLGDAPHEVERWALMGTPDADDLMIILVVDDSEDDELTGAVARESNVPADHFGGVWGTGQRDGHWLIAFQLIELGGGLERTYVTDNIHRELLDAILDVPHLVAIMPSEIAGAATTLEDMAPRIGGAMIVEVQEFSQEVARVRAERDD